MAAAPCPMRATSIKSSPNGRTWGIVSAMPLTMNTATVEPAPAPATERFRRVGSNYVTETRRRGLSVYRDPLLNKGSAFSLEERRALGLEGLLPGAPKTLEQQARRVYAQLRRLHAPIDRYLELSALQDRNEHLFYRVLRDHLAELMPIVYTPTVGEATQRFSELFRRGRGLWINPSHRGRMAEVLAQTPRPDVLLIVATDNESILGIGDQGAGGMAIAIGKLALYCATAGLHPSHTLPISLDVGTDNPTLLGSAEYLGWSEPRLRGDAYFEFLDEFVDAVRSQYPQALLQWEDLRNETALKVLDRYRSVLPSFNDDIEGTGAVAVAGVLSAARLSGTPVAGQRFVIFGGGAAGLGIARQLRELLVAEGCPPEEARHRIAVLDSRGLIAENVLPNASYKLELALPVASLERHRLAAGAGLAEVLARFQPHALIGTSGVPGAFTEEMVRGLCQAHERPLILPLSNPTTLCEVAPADALRWSRGRAIVATGSPFEPVGCEGRERPIAQGNNVLIFPGLGLGAIAARAPSITPPMLYAAARAVADSLSEAELAADLIYPRIERLPEVARAVAAAVAQAGARVTGIDAAGALEKLYWEPAYPEIRAV